MADYNYSVITKDLRAAGAATAFPSTEYTLTLTESVAVSDTLVTAFPYEFVTNSVRSSLSTLLRLLHRPVKYVSIDLPPVHAYLEPGDTIWTNHALIPELVAYDGQAWKLVPLLVVSVTDHVYPPKVTLKCVDLREVYCTWWSPMRTDIGMTPDLNGIAIVDQAGGWHTVRDQLAYGERPGGDNTFQEVLANTPIVDAYGLCIEGGNDTNHLLNSTLSEGSGDTFTSWTPTTSGSAIAVSWRLYTLIDALGFQRACQFATYAAGENAYLSQTVASMDDKQLYVRVYYKDGGAYDRMSLRVQRSSDSKYWRDSDQTWQVAATDNSITPATGVVNSLRWISKLIDLSGVSTSLTISVGHFACASAIAQISQLQGVELLEVPGDAFGKWRNPLPTKAAAITRVANQTYIVNDTAVRVLYPARGFVKLDYVPLFDHADMSDGVTKFLWTSDFDGATNTQWLRCYYTRIDASNGAWRFANPNGYATLATSGATLLERDTAYTVACRWTSTAQDEHDQVGQALDIWVDGVRGTPLTAQTEQTASATCNVYLGGSSNLSPAKTGRLAVVGGGYWSADQNASYPGYDGQAGTPPQTQYRADSDLFVDDVLHWLAQKTGTLSVLVMNTDPPAVEPFGPQFLAGLARLGHTVQLTGTVSTFGVYEPLDYDVVIGQQNLSAFTYHGLTTQHDRWDYILTNNGAILTEATAFYGSDWDRYGIDASGYHSFHSPYQRPFSCAAIGASTYKVVTYSSVIITSVANTKGGTRTLYYCDTHGTEAVIGLWSGTTLAEWEDQLADGHLRNITIGEHCPTEAELLRL